MQKLIESCVQEAIKGGVSPSKAEELLGIGDRFLPLLFYGACRIRSHFRGDGVKLCAIVNAKSGRCSEDCAFCAQSVHHKTRIDVYPMMDPEQILQRAREARAMGARRFSIVTSGKSPREEEMAKVIDAIRLIRQQSDLTLCVSLGIITKKEAFRLKEAGLSCYHHNLETAPTFFTKICTTHRFEEDLDTLRWAKEAALQVCSGGILGLGESPLQRLELAFTLKELDVDSVALNFLHPIPGTPLGETTPLPPLEILKSVALFRFILPDKDIRICGGREFGLRDLHPMIFWAGANGIMIGNYLTTKGRHYRADLQMIQDLKLEVVDG
ncbi:MAG: biotin synthase BioB [Deltaproteobacteria bacterium]|nr:MAG: biotin synthase BioB [Deltaproteobacteria bacterium]